MNADGADRYFDYAATATPFDEALSAQVEAARTLFGNPSSMGLRWIFVERMGTDCLGYLAHMEAPVGYPVITRAA